MIYIVRFVNLSGCVRDLIDIFYRVVCCPSWKVYRNSCIYCIRFRI